jgi:hypothetical protein
LHLIHLKFLTPIKNPNNYHRYNNYVLTLPIEI